MEKEPSARLYYMGIDGQEGSAYHWKGDEIGEGEMTATSIKQQRLDFKLQFIQPWESNAKGYLQVEPQNGGLTKVTWQLERKGSIPFNVFSFLMEHFIGKDFESGLENLKSYTEQNPNLPVSIQDIVEKNFESNWYASIRKKIPFSEIQKFSTEAYAQLASACGHRMQSTATCIYYDWDPQSGFADMAPSFAVSGDEPVPNAEMVHIPASKSLQLLYKGSYAGLGKAHEMMGQYVAKKGVSLSYVLEEYLSGPANEPDSNKWRTNVVYILK